MVEAHDGEIMAKNGRVYAGIYMPMNYGDALDQVAQEAYARYPAHRAYCVEYSISAANQAWSGYVWFLKTPQGLQRVTP